MASYKRFSLEVGLQKILSLLEADDADVRIHAVKVVANLAAEGFPLQPSICICFLIPLLIQSLIISLNCLLYVIKHRGKSATNRGSWWSHFITDASEKYRR